MNLKSNTLVVVILSVATLVTVESAKATLMLNLTGTPGSNVVSYTAGGSITVSEATSSLTGSGSSRGPLDGAWDSSFDNDLGNFLTSFNSNDNDNLPLSVPVPVFVGSTQIGSFDTVDVDPSSTSGNDDVELDPTVDIDYPALVGGETFSYGSVSGTFTLDAGNFEDVFNATGVFTNAAGIYVLTVNSVPEPTSIAVMAMAICCAGVSRVRR